MNLCPDHDSFPHDPDYDFGDANHLPIVPVIVEDAPDASRENIPPTQPVPGDAGPEISHEQVPNHPRHA